MKIKCSKRHSFEPIYQDFVNERMIYVESYANEPNPFYGETSAVFK